MPLIAPLYPPSARYSPPQAVNPGSRLGLADLSITELLTIPSVRRLLYAAPGFKAIAEETQMREHLGNSTLLGFSAMFPPSQLAVIERELNAEPRHWAPYS